MFVLLFMSAMAYYVTVASGWEWGEWRGGGRLELEKFENMGRKELKLCQLQKKP